MIKLKLIFVRVIYNNDKHSDRSLFWEVFRRAVGLHEISTPTGRAILYWFCERLQGTPFSCDRWEGGFCSTRPSLDIRPISGLAYIGEESVDYNAITNTKYNRKDVNMKLYPDITKAKRLLNWKPKIKFEQGIRFNLG